MKKTVFLILTILIFSCKSEPKKESPAEENTATEEVSNTYEYPRIEDLSPDINPIFTNGYNFTDNIGIDAIGIINIDEDTYKLVCFLDKDSDLKTIEELNIAFRVYPKDPGQFANQADRDAKARTIASRCDIKQMEDDLVIVFNEFTIVPKEFQKAKVYFYHPQTGVLGNMMTILDVNF